MYKQKQQYGIKKLEQQIEQTNQIFFRKLYTKLVNQQPFSTPSTINIPEILGQMSKIIVWSQRQKSNIDNGDIFDFICQVKLFDLLLDIFTKCKNVQTINAVIGFYNMLLTNINQTETILYLLSHPCILSMELTKFGTMANQLAEYYINFLKGLSRKIDQNTIHIFFNKRYPNFPLVFQTIRFFNHPQNLVRTTCRNIILTIFRFAFQIKYPLKLSNKNQPTNNQIVSKRLLNVHKYLTDFPFCIYYIHQSNFVKQYWKILDRVLQPEGGFNNIYQNQQYQIQSLQDIISDHQELLIYLDDLMFEKNQQKINQENDSQKYTSNFFISAFVNECFSQLVMSLSSIKKAFLGIKTSLLVIILLLNTVRNQFFIQTLIFCLFAKYYPKPLTNKLLHPIDTLLSYNKQWKFKGFWDGNQDKINQYCSKRFYQEKNVKSDLSKLNEQSINKSKNNLASQSFSVFGITPNYYERQVQKLQKIFGIYILKEQSQQHKQGKLFRSFAELFRKFCSQLPQINHQNINLNMFDQNPTTSNILSFLQSKDDILIMLTLCLLQKISSLKNVNQNLLNFCRLSTKPKTKDFSTITIIQRIIISCLKIFKVDPPTFRICTYKYSLKVIKNFSKIYQNQDFQLSKDIRLQLISASNICISRINPYIYGGKQWQKVIQLYLIIKRQNNKHRNNTIKTYGLIPQQFINQKDKKQKFTDQLYQTNPKDFQQQIGRDLWIYLIIKQLLSILLQNKKNLLIQFQTISLKQNNPFKYEQGKTYKLQDDQYFKSSFKSINEQRYQQCDLILLGGFLVIGIQNKTQYKLPYQQTNLISDKSDTRKIIIQSSVMNLSTQFENFKLALLFKENYMQNKKLLLKFHLSNLIKEVEMIQNLLKQYK